MTPSRLGAREERDGAVDASAHRHGDPPRRRGRGAEHLGDRVRDRIGWERLARHRGRLEEGQTRERALHPGRVRLDDPVAVDDEPRERVRVAPGGVADDLDGHRPG